jgi:hypothetical protein
MCTFAPGHLTETVAGAVDAAAACRLCLNSFGEITVMRGANSNAVRWRNSVPLGTRTNNKLPYTLTLNTDHTVTGEVLWPLLECSMSYVHIVAALHNDPCCKRVGCDVHLQVLRSYSGGGEGGVGRCSGL